MSAGMIDVPSILIVEDDADLRELLRLQLQHGGYDSVCARDGAQALEMIREREPSAVVTDVVMPVMSGIELVRRLRELPGCEGLPVLLYTGVNGDSEDLVEMTTTLPLVRSIAKGTPMKSMLATLDELVEAGRTAATA